MNIAYTTQFKTGTFKGKTPADVILKAKDKNKAIADILAQRDYLEKYLGNEKYRENNQKVIAAIDVAIQLYNSGQLQGRQSIDPSIAYKCKFTTGPYKGLSPADAILMSPNQENTVADLRDQYRALKTSDNADDTHLALAISVAGKLYNEGKLKPQKKEDSPLPSATDNYPSTDGQAKEYLTMKDTLRKGSLMVSYGKKYLCNVVPAFGIHRVRWSIVALETNGQKHWDFYMDLDDFRRFCQEIDSGIAKKKFSQDVNESVPNAYQYVAGDNGSKHLNIGGGKKGVRININIQNEGYAMTAVSYETLRDMSFYFKLVSGLIPATRYFSELADAFWEGEEERASYYR